MTRFEPPYTEPYVRWCGRSGSVRTRTYPMFFFVGEGFIPSRSSTTRGN